MKELIEKLNVKYGWTTDANASLFIPVEKLSQMTIEEIREYHRLLATEFGENGTIEIRPLEKVESKYHEVSTTMAEFAEKVGVHNFGDIKKSNPFDRYEGMLIAFADMIRGKIDGMVDLETEARIHRCLLKANGMDIDYKGEIKL